MTQLHVISSDDTIRSVRYIFSLERTEIERESREAFRDISEAGSFPVGLKLDRLGRL